MAERKAIRKITTDTNEIVIKDRVINGSKNAYTKSTRFIKRRPLASFLILLGLLLVFLIAGRLFQPQPEEKDEQQITKNVNVYSIGEGPQAEFQAKVEKSGVVKIIAQSGGIVQNIPVKEGQEVTKGQLIVSLANNYQGGNAASVQRQIAQTQYQNAIDSYGPQMDLINKQRDVATASAGQAQQTRDITRQSVNDTNGLIDANEDQLDKLREQYETLQQNPPESTDATYTAYQQLPGQINQLQGGINQLRASQRTGDLQSAEDKSPALLSNLQKEIALKQLEVQEKSINLGKEVSRLQVSLAYVSEALMYPSSPFAGTVERINVKVGQAVNPGTVLATITSDSVESTAVLSVPQAVAQVIGQGEPSHLLIGGKSVAVTPYYVSTQATDGQQYSVFYDIPEEQQEKVIDGEYISIKVPLGKAKTTAAAPLIPIDAVYQTKEKAFVLVASKEKAETRTITPGEVFGGYVQIENGLKSGDQIILNRNVITGDKVKIN